MASVDQKVLAAQYEAGARAAKLRVSAARVDNLVMQAKAGLQPYRRKGQETDAERGSRLLGHYLPSSSLALHLEAIEALEQRVKQLEERSATLKADLTDREEESRGDAECMDEQDKALATSQGKIHALTRQAFWLRFALAAAIGYICIVGSLSKKMETRSAILVVACRGIGLYFLIILLIEFVLCVPTVLVMMRNLVDLVQSLMQILSSQDHTQVPAHELAPPQLSLSERIREFYQKHCPQKLEDVGFCDRIAAKYSYPGGPEALFSSLEKRYKLE